MPRLLQNTIHPYDPVIVEYERGDSPIVLRIGRESPGETRYAELTEAEATVIACNLLRAATRNSG